jgi:hypothetical protein
MSIYKFPLKTIQKAQQYIKASLAVHETELPPTDSWDNLDDLPEPDSVDDLSDLFTWGSTSGLDELAEPTPTTRWFISTVNPAAALLRLPGLKLRPEYKMVSYLYRDDDTGTGVVWAIPEELSITAHLETALVGQHSISHLPRPEGALQHFMDAVDGDRTPPSFIIASIFKREVQEFGATGNRKNWDHHKLINALPANINWQWKEGHPKDFNPKVKLLPDGQAAVEFFTCRTSNPPTLYRHVDQYPQGLYRPNSLDKAIAVGKP